MVSGGGIFSTLGTMKMRGGTTITGNRAGDSGGGIFVQSPTGLEQFEVLLQFIPLFSMPSVRERIWYSVGFLLVCKIAQATRYTYSLHLPPYELPHIPGLYHTLNAQKYRPYERV